MSRQSPLPFAFRVGAGVGNQLLARRVGVAASLFDDLLRLHRRRLPASARTARSFLAASSLPRFASSIMSAIDCSRWSRPAISGFQANRVRTASNSRET